MSNPSIQLDDFPFSELYQEGEEKKELLKKVITRVFEGRRVKEDYDTDDVWNLLEDILGVYVTLGALSDKYWLGWRNDDEGNMSVRVGSSEHAVAVFRPVGQDEYVLDHIV